MFGTISHLKSSTSFLLRVLSRYYHELEFTDLVWPVKTVISRNLMYTLKETIEDKLNLRQHVNLIIVQEKQWIALNRMETS